MLYDLEKERRRKKKERKFFLRLKQLLAIASKREERGRRRKKKSPVLLLLLSNFLTLEMMRMGAAAGAAGAAASRGREREIEWVRAGGCGCAGEFSFPSVIFALPHLVYVRSTYTRTYYLMVPLPATFFHSFLFFLSSFLSVVLTCFFF